MSEGILADDKLDIVYGGNTYEITNMSGHTISYLKKYLASQGLEIKVKNVRIFSKGPDTSNAEKIIENNPSLVFPGTVNGKFQILQGVNLIVSDEYVLSDRDMIVYLDETEITQGREETGTLA